MSLQIKTKCVRKTAGGTITGIVFIHLTSSLEVEHLAITFSGRAQTDIDQLTTKTPGFTAVVKCADQNLPITFVSREFGLLAQDFAREGNDYASSESERTNGTMWSEESDGLEKQKLLPYA
ncbi:MAG: hypothetical protein Q9204_002394 [Flavoplaca sp. TL-2023a]